MSASSRACDALQPRENRNVAVFLTGLAVTLMGSAMVPVALTFAVLEQGGRATQVGAVLGADTLALVGMLLGGGVVADRFPRRAVMLVADLVRCVGQAVLAVALFAHHAPVPLLCALAFVLGAGQAFSAPAFTGLVPALASGDRLQGINAWIGVVRSAAQIAGPALAGFIVAAGGAGWAIAVDSASYGVSALCLLALSLPDAAPVSHEPFIQQLRLGWSEFTGRRWLWVIVLQFGCNHMMVTAPLMVLGAIIAQAHLGGASAWGLILAAQGFGAVLGGVALLRTRPPKPLAVATLATYGSVPLLLSLAVDAPLWADLVTAAIAGAGLAVFTLLFDTTMQRDVAPEALSRVSSYDWLGSYALIPIGYILAGPFAAVLGPRGALLVSASWLSVTSGIVLAMPAVRNFRDPGSVPSTADG